MKLDEFDFDGFDLGLFVNENSKTQKRNPYFDFGFNDISVRVCLCENVKEIGKLKIENELKLICLVINKYKYL